MVEFFSWVFRVFMMTINNKNKTKLMSEASTSVYLLLATALGKGISFLQNVISLHRVENENTSRH